MTNRFRPILVNDALAGRKIWVTGGGSGLGQAMAVRFAALGAAVGISGRREEPLIETVEQIKAAGGQAAWATGDVRDPEAVAACHDKLVEELGGLDGLVNNAAGNFICPSEKLSPNAFQAVVGIVLNGTFHCTSVAAKRWIKEKIEGSILSITTTYTETGSAFVLPSACAKAGVVALTRSLTAEWGKYGIRLNAISPGPIPTKGAFERLLPTKELVQDRIDKIPAGRVGSPEELAELASFIMSDGADWMRGEVVTFDGGEWMRNAGEFNFMLDIDIPWDQMLARKGGK